MTCVLNMIREIDYLRTPLNYYKEVLTLKHSHVSTYGLPVVCVGHNSMKLTFICGYYTHYTLNRLKNVQYRDGVL